MYLPANKQSCKTYDSVNENFMYSLNEHVLCSSLQVHFPDVERVEWLNKVNKLNTCLFCFVYFSESLFFLFFIDVS